MTLQYAPATAATGMTPAGVLLDMSGTLFDTETPAREAERVVATQLGWEYTEHDYRSLIGVDAQGTAEYFRSRSGGELSAEWIAGRLEAVTDRKLREYGVRYKRGAAQLLTGLASWGVPCCLVTSDTRAFTRSVLTARGVAMTSRVCFEDTVRHKPDGAPYEFAAWHRLGLDPRDCDAIEDTEVGVAAALDAACRRVYVVPSVAGVDWARDWPEVTVLRSLAELTVDDTGMHPGRLDMRP